MLGHEQLPELLRSQCLPAPAAFLDLVFAKVQSDPERKRGSGMLPHEGAVRQAPANLRSARVQTVRRKLIYLATVVLGRRSTSFGHSPNAQTPDVLREDSVRRRGVEK